MPETPASAPGQIGPLYSSDGRPLYAAPRDWDHFRSVRSRVRDVSIAALREVGGGELNHEERSISAPSGEAAQRSFRLGLLAAGVEFDCVCWEHYEQRLLEWDGSLYRVIDTEEAVA